MLRTELFDYALPPELVAQAPAARRDASRLLVADRASHEIFHGSFSDLPRFLRRGDTLIRNNASVLPARLKATRPTGGRVECLLLAPDGTAGRWRCLVRPGRKLPAGSTFEGRNGAFRARIERQDPDGSALVFFETPGNAPMTEVARREGEVPLPPYIRRPSGTTDDDRARYQTVYADPGRPVAVAAPTAGLHFTPDLLAELAGRGVGAADLTLHVGLGTFRPIATEGVEAHQIHRELYEIPPGTQRLLLSPPGRRVAVGTTAVRSIEDFFAGGRGPEPAAHVAEAGIFIYPPFAFRGADALITNFHQPRSTLLCLVAAFLSPGATDGIAWLREIYAEAIARRYRFFSYGDAMLVV